MLEKKDFTKKFCEELLSLYGSKDKAAQGMEGQCMSAAGTLASWKSIKRWIFEAVSPPIMLREDPDRQSRLEKLAELTNVPLDAVGRIQSVKYGMWGVHAKDQEGNLVTNVLDKTQITIIPKAPEFPVAQQATPNIIKYSDVAPLVRQTRQVFVYSDAQIGFLKNPETHEIDPIHDPKAMEVARKVMQSIQPDEVAIIGDWMDLSFASRWTQHAEFDAPNLSIQAAYDYLCQIKTDAGPKLKKMTFVEGNHDQRLEKMLLEYNKVAMRIKRATDTSNWPVLSLPYLLRFDELGITTTGRYPGGDYFLLPDLVLTHAPPRSAEFNASVIHGHQHKLSISPRVAHSSEGRKSYYMYDIGCLCQLGITSDPQRLMVTKVPSDRGRTDWHQGFAVVNIVDGKIPYHTVELVPIHNGKALYQGHVYGHS